MYLRKETPDLDAFRVELRSARLTATVALVLAVALRPVVGDAPRPERLRGMLVTSRLATNEQLHNWTKEKVNTVILALSESEPATETKASAERIRSAGLTLYFWIEIGRNPAMAEDHPEWMASLQGHPEWRRFFPNLRTPAKDEVVKNYPWVPLVYEEAFQAHLQRVATLLKDRPVPAGIFLNDLQSAPSACGCGNTLCRWTPGYGPINTATRLPADAGARFATAVQQLAPEAKIIPVWTTECEQPDGAKDGPCAGVGCFAGACWKEFTAQLLPVTDRFDTLAVLLPYRAFERDLPRYGPPAGWVRHALHSLLELPPRHQGKPISTNRLIAVLQGWDLTSALQKAQISRSEEAGAGGHILALTRIEQSWEPRIVRTGKK
jgi:hypothetical protein